ncbi:MAG: hypothetical protein ACU826_04830, partial [Gammaproteobacteria bacterium]
MEKITLPEFAALTEGQELLEKDRHGPKVYKTADDRIVKLFRLKRNFSSARLFPYAARFKQNAEQLAKLGFETVTVERIAHCPENGLYVVIYPMIHGESLRHMLRKNYSAGPVARLAEFVAELHDSGVYFRSLHMGNIIVTENGRFALIDIADMRIHKKPLSAKQRLRNFAHFFRYHKDAVFVRTFG